MYYKIYCKITIILNSRLVIIIALKHNIHYRKRLHKFNCIIKEEHSRNVVPKLHIFLES